MNRTVSYVLICLSLALGLGSMILFAIFLFLGSFTMINLGLNAGQALAFNAGLSMVFFCQHSIMIRRTFRERLTSLIADEFFNAFYAIVSALALFAVLILWQRIPDPLVTAGGMAHWLLRGLFFMSLAGFHWGVTSLGSFDALGIKKIQRHMKNKQERPMPLKVTGAYRWVRHPLYLFSLLMIWSCPALTADRLLFNVLWTIWIVAATRLEERDLVHEFGRVYREYQAQVPMLIPYRIPLPGKNA